MKRLALALFLVFLQTGPAGAGWEEAADNHRDYATTLREHLLLAQQGDATLLDMMETYRWAAEHGDNALAQNELGQTYEEGRIVEQDYGEAATQEVAPADLTVENLYQQALRHFRRAMELTPDKGERDELASSAAIVERALGRKRGRL